MSAAKQEAKPCNCRDELEAKLTERFAEQQPQGSAHSVTLQGYAYTMNASAKVGSGGVGVAAFMPYKASAIFKAKSGTARTKTSTGNMFFSYCPFCGKKVAR